jgi:uncharacterized protein with von Willebrand factor type A (vWA) domain
MDAQLVRFIAHLRAEGVRISLAESQDASRALTHLVEMDQEWFRNALQTTLIKEQTEQPIFDHLFPLYFGPDASRLMLPEQALTPDQQQLLEEAMRGASNELLQRLASGQNPIPPEWEQYAQQVRAKPGWVPKTQSRLTREMLHLMGSHNLDAQLENLWAQLAIQGMTSAEIEAVQRLIAANRVALAEQAARFVQHPSIGSVSDIQDSASLMQRSFDKLSGAEVDELHQQVRRLAAKLRSRAALRQKKGVGKILDAKTTLRVSLGTGGIPFHLLFKKKRLKPKFTLICDVSTSMRPVAGFMLQLMYGMQDQIAKVRSFAFNSRLEEVSDEFVGQRPNQAISCILRRIPPGHYTTNLGRSLADFCEQFLDAVDHYTVVIFLGDGRNNVNDPRLDLFEHIKRRARRVVWFNPEPLVLWGAGDSDMLRYKFLCDTVHQVSNLAQLTEAVDQLFTRP